MSSNPSVLITGTSLGLGKFLAEHFLSKGFVVYGCSRGSSTLSAENYFHSSFDLCDESSCKSWVQRAYREQGSLYALVLNTGLVTSKLHLALLATSQLDEFIQLNFRSNFILVREVSKIMMRQKAGRIVGISSTHTKSYETGASAYVATKTAIESALKVLARELASSGVTCNIVAPGLMDTPAAKNLGADEAWVKNMLGLQDVKRLIDLAEVARTIEFFLDPKASAITGQKIYLGVVSP